MTMRKISILAAVAAFAASPAMAAGEGRVLANGGIVFAGGASEAIASEAMTQAMLKLIASQARRARIVHRT